MRLDLRLVADGLVPTRSRARDLILRGFVSVDDAVCRKPSQACAETAQVKITSDAPSYVSRGAEKLEAALNHFALSPDGCIAVDIGASTGGFTEVLLKHGAARVYAVDVGTAQLHETLRDDGRVSVLEQTDARSLHAGVIDVAITFITADVSFIALRKALPAALSLAAAGCHLVALVKPQFEVGRAEVSKGGIVRDNHVRQRALDDVVEWIGTQPNWSVIGTLTSPIEGGDGNTEFLLAARFDG